MRYLLIVLMSIISASGCFGQTVENESKAFEHFAWVTPIYRRIFEDYFRFAVNLEM